MKITKPIYIILLLYTTLISLNFINAIPVGEDESESKETISCYGNNFNDTCPYGWTSCERKVTCKIPEKLVTDVLFIIDESNSMQNFFVPLKERLGELYDKLSNDLNADAKYAVIGYGGKPRLLTDFTNNTDTVSHSFNKLNTGYEYSFGHEAGLETLRMALNTDNGKALLQDCTDLPDNNNTVSCAKVRPNDKKLSWREGSEKVIFMLTDENSDIPHFIEYMNSQQNLAYNQFNETILQKIGNEFSNDDVDKIYAYPSNNCINYNNCTTYGTYKQDKTKFYEPTFYNVKLEKYGTQDSNFKRIEGKPLILGNMYQEEVSDTASILIDKDVQLYLVIRRKEEENYGNSYRSPVHTTDKDKTHLVELQYGNAKVDNGTASYGEFNAKEVYAELKKLNQENSLQGQILNSYNEKGKGYIRTFPIEDFVKKEGAEEQYNTVMIRSLYDRAAEKLGDCMVRDAPVCSDPIKLKVIPNGGTYDYSNGGYYNETENTYYYLGAPETRQDINKPTRENFRFDGWEIIDEGEGGTLDKTGSVFTYGKEDAVIEAMWTPQYKINYYVKDTPDGKYVLCEDETFIDYAEADTKIDIDYYSKQKKNYENYNYVGGYPGTESTNVPGDASENQTEVLSDGTRVVNLFYEKKVKISLTVDPNGGKYNDSEEETVYYSVPFGKNETLSVPTRKGYKFVGFKRLTDDNSGNLSDDQTYYIYGSENAEIQAQWEPADNQFTVYHYVKGVNSNIYELRLIDEHSAKTNDTITVDDYKKFPEYEYQGGYEGTKPSIEPENRDPDTVTVVLPEGDRVLNLYYVEKPFIELTVDPNGGFYNETEDITVYRSQPNTGEEIIPEPTKEGYIFKGWIKKSKDNGKLVPIEDGNGNKYIYGDDDAYIQAVWEKANTLYTVNHYVKPVGEDKFRFEEKEEKDGKVGTTIDIEPLAKEYEGYSFVGGYAGTEATNIPENRDPDTNTEVLANNKLVINLYYVEKPFIELTVDPNGGFYNETEDITVYRSQPNTGEEIIPEPTKEGYIFKGWIKKSKDNGKLVPIEDGNGNKYIYGDDDAYIQAVWEKANTLYTVNHYVKPVGEDKFRFEEKEEKDGKVGTTIDIEPLAKEYEGYSFVGGYAGTEATNIPENRDPDTNTEVLANNKLVINLYYVEKPFIELTVDPNGGFYNETEDITVYRSQPNTGEEIIPEPTKEGYIFKGWIKKSKDNGKLVPIEDGNGNKYIYGDDDAYIQAVWEKANTLYTVNHYVKPVGEDKFRFEEKEEKDGKVGTTIDIEPLAKEYEGYSFVGGYAGTEATNIPENRDPDTNTEVLANNKLVINLYYVENEKTLISLTVDPNGGEYKKSEGKTVYEAEPYSGEEPLSIPTKEGYVFKGWEKVSNDNGSLSDDGTEYNYGGSDAEIKAIWEPAEGTKYVVNYYTKCPTCDVYKFIETDNHTGKTDDVIGIDKFVKEIGDYEFVGGSVGTSKSDVPGEFVKEVTVLPDGKLHVNMYYVGKEKPEITLTVVPNGGKYNNKEENTVYTSVEYGPDEDIPDPVREGYEFKGWRKVEGDGTLDGNVFKYGKTDTVLEAIWAPAEGTKYVVSYYTKCSTCDVYKFKETDNYNGKSEEVISIDKFVKEIGNYEFVGGSVGTSRSDVPGEFVKEVTVSPDGKLHVNMYYVEKEKPVIKLTVDPNGGEYKKSEGKTVYEAEPYSGEEPLSIPTKEGYVFKGWEKVSKDDGSLSDDGTEYNYGGSDAEIKAIWEPAEGTRYVVNYYTKCPTCDVYKFIETDNHTGKTDDVIGIDKFVKEIGDYEFVGGSVGTSKSDVPGEFVKEVTVLPDGKLHVNMYYVGKEKPEITLTVVPNGGKYNNKEENTVYTSVEYGPDEDIPDPVREGYEFKGWKKVEGDGTLDGNVFKYGKTDTVLEAIWAPAEGTKYVVNYYTKCPTCDVYKFKETDNYNGKSEEVISIDKFVKEIGNYEFVGGSVGTSRSDVPGEFVKEVTVSPDGKLHVNMYYVEKEKPVIKLTVDPNGGEYKKSKDKTEYESEPYSGKEYISVPTKEGYVFKGWEKVSKDDGSLSDDGTEYNYGGSDAEIKAIWEPAEGTRYVVNYYTKCPTCDVYKFIETDNHTGKTDDVIGIDKFVKEIGDYEFVGGSVGTSKSDVPGEFVKEVTVLPDGKLHVNMYYVGKEKPVINLTIVPNGGKYNNKEENTVYTSVEYGPDEDIPDPVREGYEFKGWRKVEGDGTLDGNVFKYGKTDTVLEAIWAPAEGTKYVVSYYTKCSTCDVYKFKETDNYNGKSEEVISIDKFVKEIGNYEFVGGSVGTSRSDVPGEFVKEVTVSPDGKLHVNMYYVEKVKPVIKLTVDPNGGEYKKSKDKKVYEAEPYSGEEYISVPTKEGYVFKGWEKVSKDDGSLSDDGTEYNYGGSDAEIKAIWEPAEGTKYVVNYYTKCPTCKEYVYKETDNYTGKTDDVISIEKFVKEIGDYEFVGGSVGTSKSVVPGKFVKEVTVSPDGKLHVNMYYVEKEKPVINLTIVPNGGKYNNKEGNTVYTTIEYGPDENIPDPVREGYEFKGWKKVEGDGTLDGKVFKYGKTNTVLEAIWAPAEGTKYVVNYYTRCPTCKEYVYKETDNYKGKTDDVIGIDKFVKEIGDYEFVGGSVGKEKSLVPGEFVKEVTISPDGKLHVNMYYVEKEKPVINLTIIPNGGKYDNKEGNTVYTTVEYGPDENIPDPVREGYVFKGWRKVEGDGTLDGKVFKYGKTNTVLEAIWVPANVKYTVKYYVRKLVNEEYKLDDTVERDGFNGEVIPVSSLYKEYELYAYDGASLGESNVPGKFITEVTLSHDNKLVISLYYTLGEISQVVDEESETELPTIANDEESETELPTIANDEESQDEEAEKAYILEEDEESQDENVNEEGKCGPGVGVCKSGECCSKYGWCGTSEKYCSVENGCQSEFGDCTGMKRKTNKTVVSKVLTINKDGKCGSGIGECKPGECCSKYGWCGTSEKYCKIENGCQSEFGDCTGKTRNIKVVTTNIIKTKTETKTKSTITYSNSDRCGKNYGRCRNNECCSKYGWCGTTESYCSKDRNCQSEFGRCW